MCYYTCFVYVFFIDVTLNSLCVVSVMSGCIRCMCVWIDTRLSKQATFWGHRKFILQSVYSEKITTEHRVCRIPYLLLESQDVICVSEQSTVWPLLRGTVLFPAAPPCNTMMQMEKGHLTKKTTLSIISVLYFCQMEPSMPLHMNYLREWLAVRSKERGTRTIGGIKKKTYGRPLSFLSNIMGRIFFFW